MRKKLIESKFKKGLLYIIGVPLDPLKETKRPMLDLRTINKVDGQVLIDQKLYTPYDYFKENPDDLDPSKIYDIWVEDTTNKSIQKMYSSNFATRESEKLEGNIRESRNYSDEEDLIPIFNNHNNYNQLQVQTLMDQVSELKRTISDNNKPSSDIDVNYLSDMIKTKDEEITRIQTELNKIHLDYKNDLANKEKEIGELNKQIEKLNLEHAHEKELRDVIDKQKYEYENRITTLNDQVNVMKSENESMGIVDYLKVLPPDTYPSISALINKVIDWIPSGNQAKVQVNTNNSEQFRQYNAPIPEVSNPFAHN